MPLRCASLAMAMMQGSLPRSVRTWDGDSLKAVVLRAIDRWYLVVVIALWTFVPELRRLVDWQLGYNSLPIVALIPTVMLIPSVFALLSRKGKAVPGPVKVTAWLYAGGFLYAFVVAIALNDLIPGAYELAQFVLPLVFGIWLLRSNGLTADENIGRVSTSVLVFAALSALYGLVQFAAPPPWDVIWVQNSNLESIGSPVPFGLRIFGTLNAPGPFADILVAALLLNLRYVRASQWWRILLMLPIVAALGLSLVRADWLALAIGVAAYIILSPRRTQILLPLVIVIAISSGVLLNLNSLFGNSSAATQQFSDRLSTLGNLKEDDSAQTRSSIFGYTWSAFVAEPFGQGLGVVGTSTKLGKSEGNTAFDNGFLARLYEMGLLGFPLYIATIFVALGFTLRAWFSANRVRDRRVMEILTASLAFQVALAGLDLAGDHHAAFTGCLFWAVFALSMQSAADAAASRTA